MDCLLRAGNESLAQVKELPQEREIGRRIGAVGAYCICFSAPKRELSQKAKLSIDFSTVELSALLSLGLKY